MSLYKKPTILERTGLIFNTGLVLYLLYVFIRSFDSTYESAFNVFFIVIDIAITILVFSVAWFLYNLKNFKSKLVAYLFTLPTFVLACLGFVSMLMTFLEKSVFEESALIVFGAVVFGRLLSLPLIKSGYSKLKTHALLTGISGTISLLILYYLYNLTNLRDPEILWNIPSHTKGQLLIAIIAVPYLVFTSIYAPRVLQKLPPEKQKGPMDKIFLNTISLFTLVNLLIITAITIYEVISIF